MSYPNRDPGVLRDLAAAQLDSQLGAIDAMDGKIAVLLSLASALLGLAAATFALHASVTVKSTARTLTGWDIAVLAIGVAAYLVIAYKGIPSYFYEDWHIGPKTLKVWDKLETDKTDQQIAWEVTNELIYAFETNEKAYKRKLAAVKWIFPGVALETLAVVAAISLVAAGV